MRLFAAINFNAETRARLVSLSDELRAKALRGRYTLPENLHLTLAFIGEVSPKKLDRITAILNTVEFAPFEVAAERLGTYRGNKRGSRNDGAGALSRLRGSEQARSVATWWAGLRQDKPLMELRREIVYKLALGGFEMDGRKYSPHITLGREVLTDTAPWAFEPFGETVTGFQLMQSERINGKLTYTAIHRVEAVG
jgi:2'-5' RNA ligase